MGAIGGQPEHGAAGFARAELQCHCLVARDGNFRRFATAVGHGQLHTVGVDHAGVPSLARFTGEERRGIEADRERRRPRGGVARNERARLAIARPAHVAIGMALIGSSAHKAGVDHVSLAGLRPLVDRDERLPFVGRDRSRR